MAMRMARDAQTPRLESGKLLPIGIILIVLAAGYLGFRSGFAEWPGSTSESEASTDDSSTLEFLKTQLAEGISERQALSNRIAELDAEFTRLQLGMRELGEIRETSAQANSGELGNSGEKVQLDLDTSEESHRFDGEKLLSQDIPPDEVERLHERWVLHELNAATIADRALREGWFLQTRHGAELRQLNGQLREDLEDEGYDRYLYAVGEPNRLSVGEVFTGSSASNAGLRRGDIILRYDDKRVFRRGELLVAASQGAIGESVEMEILRDGRVEITYVERGPFGAVLDETRGAPLGD